MNISQHCYVPLFPVITGSYGANGVITQGLYNCTTLPMKSLGSLNLWFSYRENLNGEVGSYYSGIRLGVYPSVPGNRIFTLLFTEAGNNEVPVEIGAGDYFMLNNYHGSGGTSSENHFFNTLRDLFITVPESSLPVQLDRLSLSNSLSLDVLDEDLFDSNSVTEEIVSLLDK